MLDIRNGFLKISDELTIFPGFSFEQFKHTRFYKNQDGVRIIYLDEQQIIDNKKYHTEIPGKMQLVPTGIHNITTHNGGRTAGMWADAPR